MDPEADSERRILVKKARPKLMGINVTLILPVMYLATIIVFVLHFTLVVAVSTKIKGGYVITLMFGILGPVPAIYWVFALLYIYFGAKILFTSQKDYYVAAENFRRWTELSRYHFIALTVALIHLVSGCVMFVRAISLEFHAKKLIKRRNITGLRELTILSLAELHDTLFLGGSNMSHDFPLNIVANIGAEWGLLGSAVVGIAMAVSFIGLLAQESYFKWRFAHTGYLLN